MQPIRQRLGVTSGLCWGWVEAERWAGFAKTMLCFIAEELTDASGAATPHPSKLHPSLPSDQSVMDYASSPSNLDGFEIPLHFI